MSDLPLKPEKRHYTRIEEELPVQLKVEGGAIEATTQNISCGGMFLPNVRGKIKDVRDLVAFVTLPEVSKTVRLVGRVLRVEENQHSADCAVAVQFNGLYDDHHLEVDRYVKWKLLN